MPLLNFRVHQPVTSKAGSGVNSLKISFTGEEFSSNEEYTKALESYNTPQWTCCFSGQTGLTYQEALKAEEEVKAEVDTKFPKVYEKAVLEIIHHSTKSLDQLVDEAYDKIHGEFIVGEKVQFLSKRKYIGSIERASSLTIARVAATATPGASQAAAADASDPICASSSSPGSDKENSAKQKDADASLSPKKPLLYSVKLDDFDQRVITAVPPGELKRVLAASVVPTKRLLKLFIRTNATRAQYNAPKSPWSVLAELCVKYQIKDKIASLFLRSPSYGSPKAVSSTEATSKRTTTKNPVSGAQKTSKKVNGSIEKIVSLVSSGNASFAKTPKLKTKPKQRTKLNGGSSKSGLPKSNFLEAKKSASGSSTAPAATADIEVVTISSSDEEDEDYADDKPLSARAAEIELVATKKKTPKKSPPVLTDSDAESSTRYQLSPNVKSALKRKLSGSITPKKANAAGASSPKKQKKKKGDDAAGDEDESDDNSTLYKLAEKIKQSPAKKKAYKQMSLLDMAKKHKAKQAAASSSSLNAKTTKSVGNKSTPSKSTSKQKQQPSPASSTDRSAGAARAIIPPKPSQEEITAKRFASAVSTLQRYKKESGTAPQSPYAKFAVYVRRTFSLQQIETIADAEIVADLKMRMARAEEHAKIMKMSEEERKLYFDEKRRQRKVELTEIKRQRAMEERAKFEDSDIQTSTALPEPNRILMPAQVEARFGDVVAVAEFLSAFKSMLGFELQGPIRSHCAVESVIRALHPDADQHYLVSALVDLLRCILQDSSAEQYREQGVELTQIPVNPLTATELARLLLSLEEDGSGSDDDECDFDMSDRSDSSPSSETLNRKVSLHGLQANTMASQPRFLEHLCATEFTKLEPHDKLDVLLGLISFLLSTDSVEDFREALQKENTMRWKEKSRLHKEKNEKAKKEKEKKKEKLEAAAAANTSVAADSKPTTTKVVVIPDMFKSSPSAAAKSDKKTYGEDSSAAKTAALDEEPTDLASLVKRRHLLAASERAKREETEHLEKERRAKAQAEEAERSRCEAIMRKFEDAAQACKQAERLLPLGTDRNHSRYWLFNPKTLPGLYVEKGWMGPYIDYVVAAPEDYVFHNETKLAEAQTEPEQSAPSFSANEWFVYSRIEDVDSLIASLDSRGIRESKLKTELKRHYADIKESVTVFQKNKCFESIVDDAPEKSDEAKALDETLLESLKQELTDFEARLRNGALGGVEDLTLWSAKVSSATNASDLAEPLIELQGAISPTFLCGIFGKDLVKDGDDKKTSPNNSSNAGKMFHFLFDEVEESDDAAKAKQSPSLCKWISAVKAASTCSRFGVLLAILETCVKWDKSVEKAKCRICRRKKDDDKLLLCDLCNGAYHLYCLRPALSRVPEGEWHCVVCRPSSPRKDSRKRNYCEDTMSETSSGESESDASENGDSSNEEEEEYHPSGAVGKKRGAVSKPSDCCSVCKEKPSDVAEVVTCDQCSSAFHLDCLYPPLRHVPRHGFCCSDCKDGRSKSKKKLRSLPASRNSGSRRSSGKTLDSWLANGTDESDDSAAKTPSSSERPGRSRRRIIIDSDSEYSPAEQDSSRRRSSRLQHSSPVEMIPSSSRSQDSRQKSAVSQKAKQLYHEIVASRLAACLMSFGNQPHISFSRRVRDLSNIKDRLDGYRSLEEFRKDVMSVIAYGKQLFKDSSRKVNTLSELQSFVDSLFESVDDS